jgi:hypothetical protein
MKNTLKSIGAVVAGFVTVVILSLLTDTILEQVGIFPPIGTGLFVTWMLVLAFIYRSVYAVVGGYVTAALAPDRPMHHVTILGILGIIGGTLGVIAGWDLSAHWYPIALAVTAFPLTWWGGKLKTK